MHVVLELQTTEARTSPIVRAYKDDGVADQMYYTALAAAAVSEIPVHSVVLLNEKGVVEKNGCYERESIPRFVVLELQATEEQIAPVVTDYAEENVAHQAYHTALAYAAVSTVPIHTVVLLNEKGVVERREFYEHEEESDA